MVEDLEEFRPELEARLFSQLRILRQRDVGVEEMWTANRISCGKHGRLSGKPVHSPADAENHPTDSNAMFVFSLP